MPEPAHTHGEPDRRDPDSGPSVSQPHRLPAPQRAERLLDVARAVVSTLELEVVLERVLEVARELTSAQYAAVGVLDESRRGLSSFITVGVDDETRARIGDLPRGLGVLGELIRNPVPLRLDDVAGHPRSYGFPSGHPPMRTFLGVPILVDGEVFGNLYLTEKAGGSFDESDEDALTTLAQWAAVAIGNARRFDAVRTRRDELEQAVTGLAAMSDIARALGGETDLRVILELVVKRARALVSARNMMILLRVGAELEVVAAAGELSADILGRRIEAEASIAGQVLRTGQIERLSGDLQQRRFDRHGLGSIGVEAAAGLFVPLLFRTEPLGVLVAMDRLGESPQFAASDARLLEAFAVSAGTAVATARSVAAGQRQQRLNAAEAERRRWARELHDETLQGLAMLRMILSTAHRRGDLDAYQEASHAALGQIDTEIANLRALVTELRPAALDDLGVDAALRALADRLSRMDFDLDLRIDLDYEQGRAPTRHVPELEAAVYRIVQEAAQNSFKHSGVRAARVHLTEHAGMLDLLIEDAGSGFDQSASHDGFGLLGITERVELLNGTLTVRSSREGTSLQASLPVRRRELA